MRDVVVSRMVFALMELIFWRGNSDKYTEK